MENKIPTPEQIAHEYEWFSKGYDAGVWEVLDALATWIGQGGVLDANNIKQWIATYEQEGVQ